MSKSIVVGYDPMSGDRAPVRFGIAAARLTGAPVVVAAVFAGGPATERLTADESMGEPAGEGRQGFDELATSLRDEGVDARTMLVEASSGAKGIHAALESENAGLAVIGSTRRGLVGRLTLGSTAERVIHGAPCAVAVVPHSWDRNEPLKTVGVAFAPTPEGHEALRAAAAVARARDARLRVVSALQPLAILTAEARADRGRERLEALDHLERAIAELARGVDAEPELVTEDPADALLALSPDIDLLVMGSRGYGPVRAVLLGGVSRRVTAEARCPVLVLPRGADRPLEELLRDTTGAAAG